MLLYVTLALLPCVWTYTHWYVTEGGKLMASSDSLFNMERPHDLVQFLRQESRVQRVEKVQAEIDLQKAIIEKHESKDDPKIEDKLMESDRDCIKAEKPLAQQDLYTSSALTLHSYGFDMETFIGRPRNAPRPLKLQPRCTAHYNLPFTMLGFEHLDGVRLRNNLTMTPESSLAPYLHPGWDNSSDYGYFVALGLKETPTSWVLYNMASYYWRVAGNAYEAVECIRRSLHLTPRRYMAVPLLNLANVLHRASRSRDAAVVLQVLIGYNESIAAGYCAVAEVYAVTSQYDAAVAAFDRCLDFDPAYPSADVHRAAVICHRKLETALELQHENLQKTLTELQSYQERLQGYRAVHEQMLQSVTDPEQKQQLALAYDYLTYSPIDHLSCEWLSDNGRKYLNCAVSNWQLYRHARDRKIAAIAEQQRLLAQQTAAAEGAEASLEDDKIDNDKERIFLEALQSHRGVSIQRPTRPPRASSARLPDAPFLDAQWPPQSECLVLKLPTMSDMPQLFLHPATKGLPVEEVMTSYLNLPAGTEHPRPWFPPFCALLAPDPHDLDLPCCDHLIGVQRAKTRDRKSVTPEPRLRAQLLALVGADAAHWTSDAEVGQRLHTLLKYSVAPKWLVFNLAALYWRVQGVAAEAVACLRSALQPTQFIHFADVALIQLSQLAVVAGGRVDDALTLAKRAVQADEDEPVSQYLLGFLLLLRGNYTVAELHVLQALDMDPTNVEYLETMKAIRCHLRMPIVKPAERMAKRAAVAMSRVRRAASWASSDCAVSMEQQAAVCELPSALCLFLERSDASPKPLSKAVEADSVKEDAPIASPAEPISRRPQMARDYFLSLDNDLPEVLPKPSEQQMIAGGKVMGSLPTSRAECAELKKRINLTQATSTWLSVTAKGIKLDELMDLHSPLDADLVRQPLCPDVQTGFMCTMDHLAGYQLRHSLRLFRPELGLKEAFSSLGGGGGGKRSVEAMATRLAVAMDESRGRSATGEPHWALSTVASLYWRVRGDQTNALQCLRHSLATAPHHMRDLALVSMANVFQQAGMLHSALVAGGAALQLSPRFVVIHFTLANVLAALGRLDAAHEFYYSTLALQTTFEPARERIRLIYCLTGRVPAAVHDDAHFTNDFHL